MRYALTVVWQPNYNLGMPIQLEKHGVSPEGWLARKLMAVESNLFAEWPVLLAGGAVRKALFRQELGKSDIDVFFQNTTHMNEAVAMLRTLGCVPKKHPNCYGVTITSSQHVVGTGEGLYLQLITKEAYPSMEDLLQSFDFTVCQFGYKRGNFYFPTEAYEHESIKLLSYNPHATKVPSLTRYAKYLALGYTPTSDLFHRVLVDNREDYRVGHDELSDYDALYDQV